MQNEDWRPTSGVYCPMTEGHMMLQDKQTGRPTMKHAERLLLAMSKNALFVKCREHDWLRVELIKNGKPILFEGCGVRLSTIKKPAGKEKHFFNLRKIPILSIEGNE